MTPGELALMNARIDAAVAAAVAPLLRELAEQKAVDRRHSGVHHDLAASVRESSSNIKTEVGGTFDAVARRDQQLVDALNQIRGEIVTSRAAYPTAIAPAAKDAKDAKDQATTAATEARRAASWWRHPAVPFLMGLILEWLSKHASSFGL